MRSGWRDEERLADAVDGCCSIVSSGASRFAWDYRVTHPDAS
jgi:hypothetical protein